MKRSGTPSTAFVVIIIVVTGGLAGRSAAAETLDDATFFRTQVRPVLADKCFKCHGPGTQEADLRLDDRDALLELGSVVPGEPDDSELLRRVLSHDESERMPPAEVSDPLTPAQTSVLREWIERGAPYADHWAYSRDRNVTPPAASAWCGSAVDTFVLNRLERAGLAPADPAGRETLIRRVSLDLTGLPPSPEEVAAFVTDDAPDAYDRLVDRLLASPHFGERQARHWLDLARYADSNGFTVDGARSIWPYRDWVIEAFNANKPFDEFTIEQLAGDLLPNATPAQIVATGFQRNTPLNEEGGTDPEQFRVERTVDRTNTIGAVWLGLTVGCAQCHDHKYDAISQREYYQLYAFWNGADEGNLSLPTPAQQRRIDDLRALLNRVKSGSESPGGTVESLASLISAQESPAWNALRPNEVSAEKGTKLGVLEDASVLAEGEAPPTDVYRTKATLPSGRFTGLRLEALTHPSLPKQGPGRAGNGNFILSRIEVTVAGKPVTLHRAIADHSQEKYHVSSALTGVPNQGWAISTKDGNQNVDRTAIFLPAEPVTVPPGSEIEVALTFAPKATSYALGRFRLAVTAADTAVAGLPVALQRRLAEQGADPAKLREELTAAVEATRKELVAEAEAELKRAESEVTTTLVLKPLAQPRKSHIHKRGDFLNLGDEVQPATFASLPPLEPAGETPSRLDLARWLVRDDHPLTPRVLVNRVWQQYFGYGLVETENDFGIQGTYPTHPELLDWLAEDFVGSGWDQKYLHRLIVTSAAYRQASVWRDDSFEKDPRNKLLARQNRLRLEAEILRDAALAASGRLTPDLGGPGVFPPQPAEVFSFTQSQRQWVAATDGDRYRRGMYTHLWRQSQHPLMTTFDGPDAQTSCTRRNRSNTPLQALHLANDEVFVELAAGLADRVAAATMASDTERLNYAFHLCVSREPSSEEREILLALLRDQQVNHPETAWLLIARTLLNLDEFVTRE